jgi:hypothetical protein
MMKTKWWHSFPAMHIASVGCYLSYLTSYTARETGAISQIEDYWSAGSICLTYPKLIVFA